VPVDHLSEFDFAQAQELHFVQANSVCCFDGLVEPLRESAAYEIQTFLSPTPRRSEIEMRLGFLYKVALEIVENLVSRSGNDSGIVSIANSFRLRTKFFLHAIDDLAGIHSFQFAERTH
jgi:hypothetical protein